MPFYGWQGLDVQGQLVRGELFARSINDLEKILLKKNIGLLKAQQSLLTKKIRAHERFLFFSHLHSLVKARIPIYDSLAIIAATTRDKERKAMIADCAVLIAEGRTLSESLFVHDLTDELSFAMLVVSERTGDVENALERLTDHMKTIMAFKQKLRASLLGPLITLFFFFLVMIGIFALIIPRFAVLFESYHAPLPLITKVILGISTVMRSVYFISLIVVLSMIVILISSLLASPKAKRLKDILCFYVGKQFVLYRLIHEVRFFSVLSMLTNHSLPLLEGLKIAQTTIKNSKLKNDISSIIRALESGELFSHAVGTSFFKDHEIHAYLTIGESSGSLARMLQQISELSRQKVYGTLNRWAILIQPLLILLLGALIAGLIFAVYMPIITLSSLID